VVFCAVSPRGKKILAFLTNVRPGWKNTLAYYSVILIKTVFIQEVRGATKKILRHKLKKHGKIESLKKGALKENSIERKKKRGRKTKKAERPK